MYFWRRDKGWTRESYLFLSNDRNDRRHMICIERGHSGPGNDGFEIVDRGTASESDADPCTWIYVHEQL